MPMMPMYLVAHLCVCVCVCVRLKLQHCRTALHTAAMRGAPASARVLLEAGADKECRDVDGNTPLLLAARYGKLEVVSALLAAGADLSATNTIGNGAADNARQGGSKPTEDLIVDAQIDAGLI